MSKNVTRQHALMMARALLTDKEVNNKIICRSGITAVLSLSMLRCIGGKRMIETRIVQGSGRGSWDCTALVTMNWFRGDPKPGTRHIVLDLDVDRAALEKMDKINKNARAQGDPYQFMIITTTKTQPDRDKYDWICYDDSCKTSAEIVYKLLIKMNEEISENSRQSYEKSRKWLSCRPSATITGLINATRSVVDGDMSTTGLIGIELLKMVWGKSRNDQLEVIEWLSEIISINNVPYYLDANNKAHIKAPTHIMELINRSNMRSHDIYEAINTSTFIGFTDINDIDEFANVTVATSLGVCKSSSIIPATEWLLDNKNVDILIVYDPQYPNRLTIRTIKPNLDLSPIAIKYGVISNSDITHTIRFPFKPKNIVFMGKIQEQDIGFSGSFV